MSAMALATLLGWGLFLWRCASEQPGEGVIIRGFAKATDGDNVRINGHEFRLAGLDSPEWNQVEPVGCGMAIRVGFMAKRQLCAAVDGRWAKAHITSRDQYGRWIATIYVGGRDINAWMVKTGAAMAYRRYSHAYIEEEAYARQNRLGLWRSARDPITPWAWRRRGLHKMKSN